MTTIGLVVPVLVTGLASTASAARAGYTQDADLTIEKPGYDHGWNWGVTVPSEGAATPYPSTVELAGSGVVSDVDVYLYNVNHPKAEDLDVLLVGPGGQQATVLSDVGGDHPFSGNYIHLDDEAESSLPAESLQNWHNHSQPTNLDGSDEFPAPAPTSTGDSALSVFDGTAGNGTWSLYVVDDEGGLSSAEGTIGQWWVDVERTTVADHYPSTIEVANELPAITDVDVTLHGLTDPYPGSLDVMLVGPTGRQVTLLSDVYASEVTDLTITLDDEAQANLPQSRWTTGDYRPTNYGGRNDQFPAPAPSSRGGHGAERVRRNRPERHVAVVRGGL